MDPLKIMFFMHEIKYGIARATNEIQIRLSKYLIHVLLNGSANYT